MANFAALIDTLSVSGSRLTDGTANASGVVYFFQPGTNTPVNVYADAEATIIVTQPVTLGAGGRLPTQYSAGIFATQPIRLLVQDVNGTTVTDSTWIPASAGDSGYNPDQDDAAFTDSNVNDILQGALTSFGGQDWKYKESNGATARTVKSKFAEIWISVKDFGAVGDGNTVDTTAIQAAMNRVKALGGGTVYFPPGTYKIDAALSLSSTNGISFVGAGLFATTITSTHATANVFTLSSCTSVLFRGFNVKNSSTSTGRAFSLSAVSPVKFVDIGVDGFSTGNSYLYGAHCTNCGVPVFDVCRFNTVTADATARALYFSGGGSIVIGGFYNGGIGNNFEFTGAHSLHVSVGVFHSGSTVLFAAGLTLAATYRYAFIGGGGLSFTISTSTLPYIEQCATTINGSATSSAVGAAQTPVLYNGREVTLTAASGGAGAVTVNAPAILPGTAADDLNLYWDFVFKNASGGAVTWTTNAIYVLVGGVAVPGADGTTVSVRFRWDRTTSEFRECYRAVTTT